VIYRAIIRPKDEILDPEGQAVTSSLQKLGFPVNEARIGRVVHLDVEAVDEADAGRQVHEMCRQLLANPLIEVFEVDRVG
jgi:phosphoribosylformylglycinamidine synthase subunit PurS